MQAPKAQETSVSRLLLPGAIGGANWGATASNPNDGTFYVLSHDAPSIYKLSTEMPGGGAAEAAGPAGGDNAAKPAE